MEVRKPDWLKINLPGGTQCRTVKSVLSHHHLHTVCDEARCPNKEECWSNRTATFMVLGNVCTRNCRFCNVQEETERRRSGEKAISGNGEVEKRRGKVTKIEALAQEPENLAEAVSLLELQYVVVTCVTRDDLPDGGAEHWAKCINAIREKNPNCKIEVLISDHLGRMNDIQTILDAKPDVVAHNLETIERLYPTARPQAHYQRSLDVLKYISDAGFICKSGIMLGLGEEADEIEELMKDAKKHGVDIFTLGQYLQPTKKHLPVEKYVHPDKFEEYKNIALAIGIKHVESGPLVRSSYHAKESYEKLKNI
ncbi:MAG: lipoyl synthase [Candidatus Marinimicrobia bacterium]|nr:lipoyl synthase [Candidatus Neomarinimicrobiota bacterium]